MCSIEGVWVGDLREELDVGVVDVTSAAVQQVVRHLAHHPGVDVLLNEMDMEELLHGAGRERRALRQPLLVVSDLALHH